MGSAGSVGNAPSSSRYGALTFAAARLALVGALAAVVAVCGRAYGGYEISVWGPLGLGLTLTVGVLLAMGRRPDPLVGASGIALLAVGGWTALSITWGGLPDSSWEALNQTIVAVAALVLGSLIATTPTRQRLVVYAVLVGTVAQAIEVLVRVGTGREPQDWFLQRFLEGPVGYHNAQGAVLLLGVPLALWLVQSTSAIHRAAGGAAAGVLLGPLLLTQSRAALAAGAIAVMSQLLLSRNVRLAAFVLALVTVAAALLGPLSDVDAALTTDTADSTRSDALRTYALSTLLAALVLALAAAPNYASRRGRRVVAVAATVALVAAIGALATLRPSPSGAIDRISLGLDELTSESNPNLAPPGQTRLTSVSLNGRWNAWNVAWDMAAGSPVSGAGHGRFTSEWAIERDLPTLYLLQPHSLELELLAELGVIGLVLFVVFVVSLVVALWKAFDRVLAIAALAALLGVVIQASVDWTWSFPGLVVPTLLVVGVAAGAGRNAAPRHARWTKAVLALALPAALVSVLLPYVSDVHLKRARAVQTTDVSRAWRDTESARSLNPWDPEVLSLQGRLAEASGRYDLAATRYRAAARASRRPWLDRYYEARALLSAGDRAAARAACRRALAANPLERRLITGPCRNVRPAGGNPSG